MLTRGQDCADNVGAAAHELKEMTESVFEMIRGQVEAMDSIDAFVLMGHTSGASFGGFICQLNDQFDAWFNDKKLTTLAYVGFPSPNFGISHVEPYNALAANFELNNFCSSSIKIPIIFDNQALYKYCANHEGLESSSYEDCNKILASALTVLTNSE